MVLGRINAGVWRRVLGAISLNLADHCNGFVLAVVDRDSIALNIEFC